MKLRSERAQLIAYDSYHAPMLYNWYYSGQYESFFLGTSMLTASSLASVQDKKDRLFMIVNPGDFSKVYGACGLYDVEEKHRRFKIYCLIENQYQKNGLAGEATKLLLYHAFNNLNLYKAIAEPIVDNVNSLKVSERLGFEQEGVFKHEIYQNGEFKDVKRFAMLKGAFNKRYKEEVSKCLG